ncbi:hypothetical protein [Candidatus Williamhamiltonella defendens]
MLRKTIFYSRCVKIHAKVIGTYLYREKRVSSL